MNFGFTKLFSRQVTIRLSNSKKHGMPVVESCGSAYKHDFAPIGREVCQVHGTLPPQNYADVGNCVKDSKLRLHGLQWGRAANRDGRSER